MCFQKPTGTRGVLTPFKFFSHFSINFVIFQTYGSLTNDVRANDQVTIAFSMISFCTAWNDISRNIMHLRMENVLKYVLKSIFSNRLLEFFWGFYGPWYFTKGRIKIAICVGLSVCPGFASLGTFR